MNPNKTLLAFLALSLALVACAPKAVRQARRMEGRFVLGQLTGDWRVVKPGGADFAWQHPGLAAVIYADSNCGVRFQDKSPEKLVDSLAYGVRIESAVSERHFSLDGRDAYTVRQHGSVDGVPVELGVTVVNKNRCNYDIVLIAPRGESFDSAWSAYTQAVEGFQTDS